MGTEWAPLEGLSIVEGSAFVAAPSGGMTLAQLGAEVIRFDPIGGGLDYSRWPLTAEGRSLYWAGLNKGKKSIAVNLRDPAAHEMLTNLIAECGTFLTNFGGRGWMAPDRLCEHRPDLVMVVITGNRDGTTAVDYTVNAAMGFPLITGPVDSTEPVNNVVPAWDLMCGQTAAVGILAADRRRLLTGHGSVLRIALSDVALAATAALGYVAEVQVNDSTRVRCGNDLYGAFGTDLVTQDDRRLYVVAISRRQWLSLLDATETELDVATVAKDRGRLLSEFADDEGLRYEARAEIKSVMQAWAGSRPLAEAAAQLDAHGVCWGRYQSFSELVRDDPRCSPSAGLFTEVDNPGIGRYLVPASPISPIDHVINHADSEPEADAFDMTAPNLGEHTEEVLADRLGLSMMEIARLHDSGVVAGPSNP